MLDRLRLLFHVLPLLRKMLAYRPDGTASAAERIEARAAELGEKPFVRFEGRTLTYAGWNAAANRIAHWARGLGLRRGDAVALLMENRPEYLSTWAGLAKLGVTTALLNTHLTGRSLAHALGEAKAKHLIVGSECLDRYRTIAGDIAHAVDVWVERDPAQPAEGEWPSSAHDLSAALAGERDANPDPAWREGLRSRDDIFYIYTSGTTGLPKAARFSHLRFLAIGEMTAYAIGETHDDVNYCALPLYHTAGGVMLVSGAIAAGATIVLRRRFSARSFWDDVRTSGATTFQYIGEFCRYLMNQPPRPDDHEHRVRVIIGNGLRPDIWETFQKRFGIPQIVEFYGATEGNTALLNLENKVGSVGRFPFRFLTNARLVRYDVANDVHVRDERGLCVECRPGEVGELLGAIPKSEKVAAGRFEGYTSPEATEQKILRDVFRKGDSWFRTGDLLRQDEEGFFYFVDRIGDTFRWKGENVSTQEVAEAISGFGGLEMVNVYGIHVGGGDGRAGMAALLPETNASFDGRAFYEYVEKALPRYAAPLFVRLLREVEVTGTFKIRKVTLQEQGIDPERVTDPILFRDDEVRSYVPLTAETARRILAGEHRL